MVNQVSCRDEAEHAWSEKLTLAVDDLLEFSFEHVEDLSDTMGMLPSIGARWKGDLADVKRNIRRGPIEKHLDANTSITLECATFNFRLSRNSNNNRTPADNQKKEPKYYRRTRDTHHQ